MGKIMNYLASSITGGNPSSSMLPFNDFGAFDKSNPISSIVETASSLSTDIADALGDIAQITNMAYCIGKLITSPGMFLNVLDSIGGMLFSTAFDIADRILGAMQGQINQMLAQITGTAINAINAAFGFLNAVVDFAEAIINLIDSIAKLGTGNLEYKMSQEDCEFLFAAIAGCMLNQLFGNKLKEFENSIIGEINEVGQEMNSNLSDKLASTNAVSNYVQHQSFLMNKATTQINGINNIIS